MPLKRTSQVYASPVFTRPTPILDKENKPVIDKPSGKPDWLLILVGILFLLTLLVAWLSDRTELFY